MININDKIAVYDAEIDADVTVTVIAIEDIVITKHVETDDRVYPGEQHYSRVYTVRLPNGIIWNAVAEWIGESNEDSAYIYMEED